MQPTMGMDGDGKTEMFDKLNFLYRGTNLKNKQVVTPPLEKSVGRHVINSGPDMHWSDNDTTMPTTHRNITPTLLT
jgi:hypothetical protein